MHRKMVYDICRTLTRKGLLNADRTVHPILYRLSKKGMQECRELSDAEEPGRPAPALSSSNETCSELMKKLNERDSEQATERDRRIGAFFKERIALSV